ncbi:hypothetical protein GS003_000904 [Salmonella enterica]|nr:hypothetical protein [Salmonella enterica]
MKIQVSFAKLYREANNRHEHKKNPPSSGFFIVYGKPPARLGVPESFQL